MSQSFEEELIQRYFDAFNRHDIDALIACFHDEPLLIDMEGGRHEGRDAVRRRYEYEFASFPDGRCEMRTQLRDRLERGQLVGPRLLITGPTLSSPDGFPVIMCGDNSFCRQMGFRVIESEEQARQVVRELSRAKVDAVKVIVDDYFSKVPALSEAVISALVDETHRAGLRIIAHVSVTKDVATARRLLELGVDEFAHFLVSSRRGPRFALVPINDLSTPNSAEVSQIAGMLVARNIPVTTTISNGDAYRDTTGVERSLFGGNPPYPPAMRERLEWVLNTVREFADAGVKLVVGTDAGGPPRVTVSYGMTRASSLVPGPFTKWTCSVEPDCPRRRS